MRVKIHPRDNPDFLLPRNIAPRARKRVKKAKTPEAVTQDLTEQYLDRLGLSYVRIPDYVLNIAFRYTPDLSGPEIGIRRAASSYLKGLPDLLILRAGRYLALELKSDTGKLSAAQRLWRSAIGTKEARSFEEAKAAIDGFTANINQEEKA